MWIQKPIRLLFAMALGAATVLSIAATGSNRDLVQDPPLPSPTPLPVPPSNDRFADATLIESQPFSDSLDALGATTEPNEPVPSCAGSDYWGKTVWYTFTPGNSGLFSAYITNNQYYTFIAVYTGESLEGLTEVGCSSWNSRLDVNLEAGTTYHFQVGDVYGIGGYLVFNLKPLLAPVNDDFAAATVIDTLPFSNAVDTYAAGVEASEPMPSCAQSFGWDKTVWYQFVPAASGAFSAYITEGQVFTFIAIWSGDSLYQLTEVGCNVYDVRLDVHLEAGTTYHFQVGGVYGIGGDLVFNLKQLLPPENDDFAAATAIDTLPFSAGVSTQAADTEVGEPTPSCMAYYPWGKSVWYRFAPDDSGLFSATITENQFDTFIAVYTGELLDQLDEVGCTSWDGRLNVRLEAGSTYYFQVGDVNDIGGNLVFNLEQRVSPANDDFARASAINALPFSESVDISWATTEVGEPASSCMEPIYQTIWYAYTPIEDQVLSANALSGFANFVAAYTGDALSSLTEQGCRGWGYEGLLTLFMDAGVTTYFQVGSVYGDGGELTFKLDVPPAPEADFNFWPDQPSILDDIWFENYSWDPAGVNIASQLWDFGDGTVSTEWSTSHRYAADADYTVQLSVTTGDGRTASTSRLVAVRTHDVAITKFAVPAAASAGQTRKISVGVNNRHYPERVEVVLFKSVPDGYEWVGSLVQSVPVRPANRTTDFSFSYTFTAADASIGKVTFKAVANLPDARDALPANNEAIARPTKVK